MDVYFRRKKGRKASPDLRIPVEWAQYLGYPLKWRMYLEFTSSSSLPHDFRTDLHTPLAQVFPPQGTSHPYLSIRSRLEHSNAVFVGMSRGEASTLERIQRRCHKIICCLNCERNAFPQLEVRRLQNALKFPKKWGSLRILSIFERHQCCHLENGSQSFRSKHNSAPPMPPHGKRITLFPF